MDELAKTLRELVGEEYRSIDRALLLDSGGLDSQVVGAILQEWGVEVTALVLDMGGPGGPQAVEAQAKARFGQVHRADITSDIRGACEIGVQTHCITHGYLNSGGFSRPFMAQAAARIAHEAGIGTIVHGHSGLSDDHLRFELSMRAIAPELGVLAPVRDWDLRREQSSAYAKRVGLKLPPRTSRFSIDENLWGRTAWQGELLEPDAPIPEGVYGWGGVKPAAAGASCELTLHFERGVAVGVECTGGRGQERGARGEAVIPYLNLLGARYGLGRRDLIVDKLLGPKLRELHEGPAAEILVGAHAQLEELTLTGREQEAKEPIERAWNRLVYEGGWFTRLRHYYEAFLAPTQECVEGDVRLRLRPGRLEIEGRSSPYALYDPRLGSSGSAGVMAQSASRHLSRLMGLQETLAYRMRLERP